MKTKKRYFICFYLVNSPQFRYEAYSTITTDNNKYINKEEVVRKIKEDSAIENPKVIFTNIIELSESDFKDWIAQ